MAPIATEAGGGEPDYEQMYEKEVLDVTGEIQNFEKGKTVTCPECGQAIGQPYGPKTWVCATCNRLHLDKEAGDREPPEREKGQAGLNEFL